MWSSDTTVYISTSLILIMMEYLTFFSGPQETPVPAGAVSVSAWVFQVITRFGAKSTNGDPFMCRRCVAERESARLHNTIAGYTPPATWPAMAPGAMAPVESG